MGEWQPIATAPKDGRQLLLFCDDYDPAVFVGAYGHTELPEGHEDYWEGWSFSEELLMSYCSEEPEPTHWQPLPDPPTT
jgi:hypothetical protein